MENDFTNLTTKVLENLDNPIKSYDFLSLKVLVNLLYAALSCRWNSATICDVTTVYNYLIELYTNFTKLVLFVKIHLPSTFILRYVRAKMIVYAFMIELDQPDYWYPRQYFFLKCENLVQSQWRVIIVLSWYHIFWQNSVQGHIKLCISSSIKWIIQICSKFYCWVSKIAFHSPNPHYCLGKLPLYFIFYVYFLLGRVYCGCPG